MNVDRRRRHRRWLLDSYTITIESCLMKRDIIYSETHLAIFVATLKRL